MACGKRDTMDFVFVFLGGCFFSNTRFGLSKRYFLLFRDFTGMVFGFVQGGLFTSGFVFLFSGFYSDIPSSFFVGGLVIFCGSARRKETGKRGDSRDGR